MFRECMVVLGLLILVTGVLAAQPVGTVYDLHLRYDDVEMIELVPGVEVRADMWPDDHVVTIGDLVSVGLSRSDATAIVNQSVNGAPQVPCTWGELKRCSLLGIPLSICCSPLKDNG